MLSTQDVQKLVATGIPGAQVEVIDLTGTSDHFRIHVVASLFEGKSLIQRHKMVHAALGTHLTREIHAVDLRTKTPAEL